MKGKTYCYTLLEMTSNYNIGDECPMIGTVLNVFDSDSGVEDFWRKFDQAIESHFDVRPQDVKYEKIDINTGSVWDDVEVSIDSWTYIVRIIETWVI